MSTSLADLLGALDGESCDARLTPADAAAALRHVAGSTLLVAARLGAIRRDEHTRSLHTLGAVGVEVAEAWPAAPARCAQLAGVIEDVLELHISEFNQPDLMVAGVWLTALVNRFAFCIQENSPSFAPALDELIANASEVRRYQAAHPASARDCRSLFRPFSLSTIPADLSAAQVAAESMDSIVDFLEQSGRTPLSVRQVIAVCRVSEVVSARLEDASERRGSLQAASWRELREKVALLSDGQREPGFGGNQRVMMLAAQADQAVTAMSLTDLKHSPAARRAASVLPSIAKLIAAEVRCIRPTLIVPVGDRPLAGQSAGYWLRGIAYRPRPEDLEPIYRTTDRLSQRPPERVEAIAVATLSIA